MLKRHICVACEKVIFEYQTNPDGQAIPGPATLVSLFQKITAVIPANSPEFPAGSLAPREWGMYSSWDIDPGDELRKYILCTQIFYPDETPFGGVTKTPVIVHPNKRSQMYIRILGFPLGQAGFYKVRTWIEENDKIVVEAFEEKIELEIIKQEVPQQAQ